MLQRGSVSKPFRFSKNDFPFFIYIKSVDLFKFLITKYEYNLVIKNQLIQINKNLI